jgi:hypothetical protein
MRGDIRELFDGKNRASAIRSLRKKRQGRSMVARSSAQ